MSKANYLDMPGAVRERLRRRHWWLREGAERLHRGYLRPGW